ncbi:hypothetical protein [Ramlibacter rhizophilus]|uniref:Uncharacterized protein n=1 Tax=Ramlibacter rhizophilus TaxID=1781167 RepID=A0A4Z0C1X4_9BURK|nr:hypothetical protein [Ramlibacter rhizophilus]TFZ04490.1 hypothetical protein EZ242_01700 [Ramlibacter rhizophilus]
MDFLRSTCELDRNAPSLQRRPARLDALRALQSWKQGYPGRAYQIVRSCPLADTGRISAKLTATADDPQAEADLSACCARHALRTRDWLACD